MRIQIPSLLLLVVCSVWIAQAHADPDVPEPFHEYRGKVVLVDFWASWCGPCLRSFPWLNRMQAEYADRGLVVLGVNLDKNRADADVFIEKLKPRFKILYDDSASLAHQFGVETMPSSFVLDARGEVVMEHRGFTTKRAPEFERKILIVLENHQAQFSDTGKEIHRP